MEYDKALFDQLRKLVKRAEKLDAAVVLTQDNIEVYHCKEDGEVVVEGIYTYSFDSWHAINTFLDSIANQLKKKWAPQFAKLSASTADGDVWGLDLTGSDCVVLEIGNKHCVSRYELP